MEPIHWVFLIESHYLPEVEFFVYAIMEFRAAPSFFVRISSQGFSEFAKTVDI